jgi:hypothetical protein
MGSSTGLCPITQFAKYDYDEYAQLDLSIPARETPTAVPFVYRTAANVRREVEERTSSGDLFTQWVYQLV